MKNYFVYDGIADHIFYDNGYRAKYTGRIGGAKLMFAAADINRPIYPAMYADDDTADAWIEGTVWEIDDSLYDLVVNGFYGDYRLIEGLQFESNDGEIVVCDTCVMPVGVFAIPDEVELAAVSAYYASYNLDQSLLETAYKECEQKVCSDEAS